MNKFFIILSFILCAYSGGNTVNSVFARVDYTIIDTKIGYVTEAQVPSKVILKGKFSNKGLYAENIIIEVYNLKTNKLQLTIKPKVNSGYMPRILLEKFDKSNMDKIFLGIDSGGSGGFGFFYVYDVKNNIQSDLFDFELFNKGNNYAANYLDYYKVKVVKSSDKTTYLIDLSLRNNDYLQQIYNFDGKLKKSVDANVSGVNTVFPYFNSTAGYFQLQVLQRITGLYNADSLGYVNTQMTLEDNTFKSYFTTIEIFGENY